MAISLDIDLVSKLALKSMPLCIILAATLFVVFVGLWFVFPRLVARQLRRNRARRHHEEESHA